jgi:hypothetical protein
MLLLSTRRSKPRSPRVLMVGAGDSRLVLALGVDAAASTDEDTQHPRTREQERCKQTYCPFCFDSGGAFRQVSEV